MVKHVNYHSGAGGSKCECGKQQLQTISDDNDDFVPAGEMVQRLLQDDAHLAKTQRAAHAVCEKSHDFAISSILENIIDESERRKWFLFEITQDMKKTG